MVLPLLAAVAPFAPLIGGLIGGLGQLFAPKPKPTTVKSSLDLVGMRAEAERAGFNPLAVLRSGGAMGFGTNVTSAAPDMRFSNFLGTIGAGISNWNYDPVAIERGAVELAIAKKQLAGFSANGAPSNLSFGVPKIVRTSEAVTMPTPFGLPALTVANPKLAEDAQTHFGDVMENLYGVGNFIDSFAQTLTGYNPRTHVRVHPFVPGAASNETNAEFQLRMKKAPLFITVRGGAN